MIKLQKPPYIIKKVFDNCLPKQCLGDKAAERLLRIESYEEAIIAESEEYDAKASTINLYKLRHLSNPDDEHKQLKEDMSYLYDSRFRDANCGSYYTNIRFGAKFCPYCGKRFSTTTPELDHFLPKAYYPLLAVTPVNLIPACRECNGLKHGTLLHSQDEQFFHPYYENLENEIWIKADVIHNEGVEQIGFIFKVDCPKEWTSSMKKRALNQFEILDLARRYPIMIGEGLAVFLQKTKRYYQKNGVEMGKQLAQMDAREDEADKEKIFHKNHYHLVMLRALLEDDWFWDVYMKAQM